MSDDFWARVELASDFKPYKHKELYLRPLTTSEVKKIEPAINMGDGHEVLEALKDHAKPMRLSDLTTGDAWQALLWIRNNTFPNLPLTVTWSCPHCSAENTTEITNDNVKVDTLPDEYSEPAYVTLPSGKEVPLRYPRAGDHGRVSKYLHEFLNRKPTDAEVSEARTAITLCIEGSLANKLEYLRELTPEDVIEVDNFSAAFEHGILEQVEDTCKECAHVNKHVRFRFLIFDLIPKGRDKATARASVCFRKVPQDTNRES